MDCKQKIRCVIIESPYAGNVPRNEEYARRCIVDCLGRGEAPFASHLLYTQDGILCDDVPEERAWGIGAGHEIGDRMDVTVVYTDLGITGGMIEGIKRADKAGRPVEHRRLQKSELNFESCALEELNMWMAEWDVPEGQRDWLLRWAVRRSHNVFNFLFESMRDIAQMETPRPGHGYRTKFNDAQFVARCALRVCALNGGDNANSGNPTDTTSSDAGSSHRGVPMGDGQSSDVENGNVR